MFALLVSAAALAQWGPMLPELYEAPPPHLTHHTVRQRRREYTAALSISGAVIGGGVALGLSACGVSMDLPAYTTGGCSVGRAVGGTMLIALGGTGVLLTSARHAAYAMRTAEVISGPSKLGRLSLATTGGGVAVFLIALLEEEEWIFYGLSVPLITTGAVLGYVQSAQNVRLLSEGESAGVSLQPVLSPEHQGARLTVRW